jgi:hypothetical protein
MSTSKNSQLNNFSSLKNKEIIFPNYLAIYYLINFGIRFGFSLLFLVIFSRFTATDIIFISGLTMIQFSDLIDLNKALLERTPKIRFLLWFHYFLSFLFALLSYFIILQILYGFLTLDLNNFNSRLLFLLIYSLIALFLLPTLKFALEKLGFSFKESGYGD